MLKEETNPAETALGEIACMATIAGDLVGKYVIVRASDAGVHSGVLRAQIGREVRLTESRRLWYWKCAKGHTLNGVALHGLAEGSKIAGEVGEIVVLDACEIIETTEAAETSIRGIAAHDPN